MARKTSSPFTLSSSQPSFSTNNYPRISSISYLRSPLKPFLVLYFKCLDEIFEEKLRKHLPLFFFKWLARSQVCIYTVNILPYNAPPFLFECFFFNRLFYFVNLLKINFVWIEVLVLKTQSLTIYHYYIYHFPN